MKRKSPKKSPRKSADAKPTQALKDLMREPSIFESALLSTIEVAAKAHGQSMPGLEHIREGKPYLPVDPAARKGLPVATGFLDYFPLAILEVARVSVIGNNQHNPGEPLHWARGKSMDQTDTAVRHIMERGGKDTDGAYHLAKAIWRLCADLQIEIEKERGLPPSRACWV